jgi:hypothetical protein
MLGLFFHLRIPSTTESEETAAGTYNSNQVCRVLCIGMQQETALHELHISKDTYTIPLWPEIPKNAASVK